MRNLVLKDPLLIGGSGDGAVVSENIRLAWRQVRAPIVVPLLQAAVYVCAAMSLMLFIERVYMAAVILCVKILRRKRYTKYKLDAMKQELEASNSHPMVLGQVYRLSIGAACGLSWPSDKIIIQVLDDSTDMILRVIKCQTPFRLSGNASLSSSSTPTSSRNPTSSGGLSLSCSVTPNLLWFKLDGTSVSFLDSGGWKDRTTVEDMDLAVRASLRGWKFVFVGDLSVKNELPSTFKAYRYQQHRWSCGPANLFRKMFKEIINCKRVSVWKKFHVIYAFFFVRKIVAHFVTSIFYCIVIPACVLVPEVHLPKFIAIYVPSTITILNALLLCDL